VTQQRHAAIRKADFSSIYDRPDPRAYYRVLDAYDYQTPAHAQRVFRRLLEAQGPADEPPQAVCDLCCSYGIIGALLACDVTWRDLCDRYNDRSLDDLLSGELVAADRAWYAHRRLPGAPRVAGLDVAARAVAYGELAGLLRPGLVENLERQDPTDAVERAVSEVGLVTASGGMSYLTERTFGRLLKRFERPPWVATFVLRAYDYAPVAHACAGHGLVTERLDGVSFRQRRFATAEERRNAVEQLAALERDPSLEADDGYYHTELFVSRPPDETARRPLVELLGDVVACGGHG
jgi:hypothetical protein